MAYNKVDGYTETPTAEVVQQPAKQVAYQPGYQTQPSVQQPQMQYQAPYQQPQVQYQQPLQTGTMYAAVPQPVYVQQPQPQPQYYPQGGATTTTTVVNTGHGVGYRQPYAGPITWLIVLFLCFFIGPFALFFFMLSC